MTASDPPQVFAPTPPLLPAGRRWGMGAASVAPYLRDAWAARPRNPVFTAGHIAALVWPAAARKPRQDKDANA